MKDVTPSRHHPDNGRIIAIISLQMRNKYSIIANDSQNDIRRILYNLLGMISAAFTALQLLHNTQ